MATIDFSEQIAGLDPRFRPMALAFLQAAQAANLDPRIQESVRDMDRQAKLYAQGRTTPGPIVTYAKPGSSAHNHGLAFDVVPGALLGSKNWSPEDPRWAQLGQLAVDNGLDWGGNWKMGDKPHIQMPNWRKFSGEGQPQAPGTPAPAMPPAVEVADRTVTPMTADPRLTGQPAPAAVPDGGSGLGALFANMAPAVDAMQPMVDAEPVEFGGSGDPMAATIAAAQNAQKAKGLAAGLAPDISALMGLGKRPRGVV